MVTSYRRIRAKRATRSKSSVVPRLVITDTSMFPTSNVVVDDESDLDKVIASFKPIGADLHIPDCEVAAPEVCSPQSEEEDDQPFPVSEIPRPKCTPEIIIVPESDHEDDFDLASRQKSQPDCIRVTVRPVSEPMEIEEPVWWYDFRGQEYSDSSSSLSEADKSISSGSLYSTNRRVSSFCMRALYVR